VKRGLKFRVGQTVCSIYDPRRPFQIDKSAMPDRIFREKGSDRWWTKSELLAINALQSNFAAA
jgi:hypothetical protein